MVSFARLQRIALAKKRLLSVLRKTVVANDRTLEQKISDAGPTNQRVEPHILTVARNELVSTDKVKVHSHGGAPWFSLTEADPGEVQRRLDQLVPIYERTQDGRFTLRVGQALEIAIYRGLQRAGHQFVGHFSDLEEHGDEQLYKKMEPPMTVSGKRITRGGPLDFVVFGTGGPAGLEAKNYRQWIYPDRAQVKELLSKCAELDAVPVLIVRRFPYITFRMLNFGGVIVHQMYTQLYPAADEDLARQARAKELLGYHDVRSGNEPDGRLVRFLEKHLSDLVEEMRPTFNRFKAVHTAYATGKVSYREWVRAILVANGVWAEREESAEEADESQWEMPDE